MLALVLAAINQIFSLLDPLIFRHIIDDYATQYDEYTSAQFFRGVACCSAWRSASRSSRASRRTSRTTSSTSITQRVGAQLYSDGIRHSLALPFQVFEDQRSGETLGKLQKVRSDTEKVHHRVREHGVHDAGRRRSS